MTALNTFRLDGRLALVTGASSGLGAHFARLLAEHGAHVVLAARNPGKFEPVARSVEAVGGKARIVAVDVSKADHVRRCLDEVCAWDTPDILVSNAGVAVTRPLLEQTEADYDAVLDTNLRGSWLMATETARRMVAAQSGGAIVNVASILGERVAAGVSPYAISKAGLLQATKWPDTGSG